MKPVLLLTVWISRICFWSLPLWVRERLVYIGSFFCKHPNGLGNVHIVEEFLWATWPMEHSLHRLVDEWISRQQGWFGFFCIWFTVWPCHEFTLVLHHRGLTCWVNHFFIPSCVSLITALYRHLTGVVSFWDQYGSLQWEAPGAGNPACLWISSWICLQWPVTRVGAHVCILQWSCDKCTASLEGLA